MAGAVLGHGARGGVACSGLGCGQRSKTTSVKGIGGRACAHRGLGLHWEAGQSRRRWSPAAWRRPVFEERSLRGPRNSWAPQIDARGSCEYATGSGGSGIAGGKEITVVQEPSPSGGPAQFRRRKGLGPVQGLQGACWSYGEASVGFSRG